MAHRPNCSAVCRNLVPWTAIEHISPPLEGRIPTTRPQRKSLLSWLTTKAIQSRSNTLHILGLVKYYSGMNMNWWSFHLPKFPDWGDWDWRGCALISWLPSEMPTRRSVRLSPSALFIRRVGITSPNTPSHTFLPLISEQQGHGGSLSLDLRECLSWGAWRKAPSPQASNIHSIFS